MLTSFQQHLLRHVHPLLGCLLLIPSPANKLLQILINPLLYLLEVLKLGNNPLLIPYGRCSCSLRAHSNGFCITFHDVIDYLLLLFRHWLMRPNTTTLASSTPRCHRSRLRPCFKWMQLLFFLVLGVLLIRSIFLGWDFWLRWNRGVDFTKREDWICFLSLINLQNLHSFCGLFLLSFKHLLVFNITLGILIWLVQLWWF